MKFPDLEVLRFEYRLIQLRRLNWRDFVRQPNPVAAALMAKMGMKPEERPRVKLECLRLLTSLRLNPAKMRLISGFVDTYLRLNAEETLQFQREGATVLAGNDKAKVMELTTSWKEEGRQEGQAQLVLRLVQHRWGSPAPEIQERIRGLSVEQLEGLAEALFDFRSQDDLQRWLQSR